MSCSPRAPKGGPPRSWPRRCAATLSTAEPPSPRSSWSCSRTRPPAGRAPAPREPAGRALLPGDARSGGRLDFGKRRRQLDRQQELLEVRPDADFRPSVRGPLEQPHRKVVEELVRRARRARRSAEAIRRLTTTGRPAETRLRSSSSSGSRRPRTRASGHEREALARARAQRRRSFDEHVAHRRRSRAAARAPRERACRRRRRRRRRRRVGRAELVATKHRGPARRPHRTADRPRRCEEVAARGRRAAGRVEAPSGS